MAKDGVSLFCLFLPLLAATMFAACWSVVVGPQMWLVVVEVAAVAFPILWHLPTLIRLAAKVAVVILTTIAVSVAIVIQLSQWCAQLKWMTVLPTNLATTVPTPARATVSTAGACLAAGVAGAVAFWLAQPARKAGALPVTVTTTEQRDVWTVFQKQQEELKEIRATLDKLIRLLTRVTAVQQVDAEAREVPNATEATALRSELMGMIQKKSPSRC
eukprot:Blabericola_migrator_1__5016@NODE_2601_length_2552_cov_375_062374_g1631_i0_p1_GENE_NODE_2601_length_2552_cov_375_062374_g1631_i0NODE_2601_length_2552_cov_375_062374_g1631_i0_p1_ORF_typecomplete_len216_score17_41Phage_prot_Gp6/PF05133_14/0_003PhaC_N/PF07167_13/0_22HEPN_SAV_6107/PF18726_1/1_1CSG2/PF16965_5/1_24HB_MCP_1/PF12729_7/1_2e024HB_MCP_1/PF12729_7/3_2_NODE_2601_length_2552_cov_375_062374_g1631_i014022049